MSSDSAEEPSLRAVGRSAIVLTGGTIAVQIIGIVRELYIAAQVGVSRDLDAFLIALVLPTTLSGVLTSGMVTAIVPAYVETRDTLGRRAARVFSGAVLAWVGLGAIGLAVVLALLAGTAVSITGPGLDATSHDQAVRYLQFLSPIAFIAAVTGILYALCQAEERFRAIAIGSIVGTATTLVTMIVLWNSFRLGALAAATLLGQSLNALILLASAIRASAAPRLTIRPKGLGFGAFVRHAAPLTLSSAILQLNVISDRAIASLLAPGGVSALRYAEVLVRTPISAISPAWGAAMYPALVRAARSERASDVGSTTRRSIQYAIAAFVPIAVLTAAVAPVAVAVAYGRGAFTTADIGRTAGVVAGFAPLIVILMTSPVLAGAHNARRRGTVLLTGGVINVAFNLVLDVAFGLWLGVAGIALSSAVASTVVVTFFARRLASSDSSFEFRPLVRTLLLSIAASAPAAVVIGILAWGGFVPQLLVPGFIALAIFGATGIAAYIVIGAALGLEQPAAMLRLAVDQFRRTRRPDEPAR